jgi:hypothetical protein
MTIRIPLPKAAYQPPPVISQPKRIDVNDKFRSFIAFASMAFQQIYWESRWIPMPAAEWEAGCLDALRTPFYREYLKRSLQS